MEADLIAQLIKERRFCDVFDDSEEETFYGVLLDQSESLLELEHFDEEGRPEGVLILRLDDVSRIRWGSREITLTEKLISRRVELPTVDLTEIRTAAKDLQNHFGYIAATLGAYDSDLMMIGEITNSDEDTLLLHEYGTRSRDDRSHCLMKWSDITRVQAGGIYEENLHKHYNTSEQDGGGQAATRAEST